MTSTRIAEILIHDMVAEKNSPPPEEQLALDSAPATPESCDHLSYEQALQELEEIVRRLEKGSARLEETVKDYERGEQLRKHCEKLLAQVQDRIEQIESSNGKIATRPLQDSD